MRFRVDERNRRWWTLGAVSFALFMIMLDNTIVNVALPSIGRGLQIGVSQLEWVVNAYTLTFAVLMLTGGRVADLYGRRLVFAVGLGLFTLSSLACGLAPDPAILIAARSVQGAGGALMMPASLSIITAAFAPEERGTAIGIWAGVSGSALAIGPLLGGLLTEHVGWSWIFFVNVPVGAVAIAASFLLIDETRARDGERRLDLAGLATSAAGLLALVYALIEANSYGWSSARILSLFALATLLLGGFLVIESRSRHAMLDLMLFRKRTFAGANVAALLVSLAMFGIFFFVSLYMQNILRYSPVHTGVVFLPMTFLVVVSAPLAGKLTDLIGARWPISAGMLLLTVGLLSFARLGAQATFTDLLPGMILGGLGMGMAMGPMTTAALSTAPVDDAGVVSGVITTSRQVGGSLGVALMGAIVAGAEHVGPRDPRFPREFVHGFRHALETGAAITLAGSLLAALLVRHEASGAREMPYFLRLDRYVKVPSYFPPSPSRRAERPASGSGRCAPGAVGGGRRARAAMPSGAPGAGHASSPREGDPARKSRRPAGEKAGTRGEAASAGPPGGEVNAVPRQRNSRRTVPFRHP